MIMLYFQVIRQNMLYSRKRENTNSLSTKSNNYLKEVKKLRLQLAIQIVGQTILPLQPEFLANAVTDGFNSTYRDVE